MMTTPWAVAVLVIASLAAGTPSRTLASPLEHIDDGRLRVSLSAGDVFNGRGERLSDQLLQASLECEWWMWPHVTMALRAHPGFVYLDPTVIGIALGALNRLYTGAGGDGAFVELGASALAHRPRFASNTAYVNILSTFAVGYQPPRGWLAVSLVLQHVSNAGLAAQNLGWNALSLRVGYRGGQFEL